jgi:Cu-Zn family superoxide dismutase
MSERRRIRWGWSLLLVLVLLLLLVACREQETQPPAAPTETLQAETMQGIRAVAKLQPTADNRAAGTVTFEAVKDRVRVTADLTGLPAGNHGFHIHEKGDCSAADGTSAGGHFNPAGSPHGGPDSPAAQRHVGDLGNLQAAENGTAHYAREDMILSLEGPDSIVGKAVIVHAGADDLTSQPTGNAGPRLACGVIRREGGTE